MSTRKAILIACTIFFTSAYALAGEQKWILDEHAGKEYEFSKSYTLEDGDVFCAVHFLRRGPGVQYEIFVKNGDRGGIAQLETLRFWLNEREFVSAGDPRVGVDDHNPQMLFLEHCAQYLSALPQEYAELMKTRRRPDRFLDALVE